jgi:hypothetical protein
VVGGLQVVGCIDLCISKYTNNVVRQLWYFAAYMYMYGQAYE